MRDQERQQAAGPRGSSREGAGGGRREGGARTWGRALRVALLAALWGMVAGVRVHGAQGSLAATCEVASVEDAATLELRCPEGPRLVRLAGVVAPRPGTSAAGGDPLGDEARAWVATWLGERQVETRGAVVSLAGRDVRSELLERGLVSCEPRAAVASADALDCPALERGARAAGRGIWSYGAWRRHQASRAEPVELRGEPDPGATGESLGAVAARYERRSPAERQADFAAALAVAAATHVHGADAMPPALGGDLRSSGDRARVGSAVSGAVPGAVASAVAGEPEHGRRRGWFPAGQRCSPLERDFCAPVVAADESAAAPPAHGAGGRGASRGARTGAAGSGRNGRSGQRAHRSSGDRHGGSGSGSGSGGG